MAHVESLTKHAQRVSADWPANPAILTRVQCPIIPELGYNKPWSQKTVLDGDDIQLITLHRNMPHRHFFYPTPPPTCRQILRISIPPLEKLTEPIEVFCGDCQTTSLLRMNAVYAFLNLADYLKAVTNGTIPEKAREIFNQDFRRYQPKSLTEIEATMQSLTPEEFRAQLENATFR